MADDTQKTIKKLNVSDFIRNKTIKLSDAYRVRIKQVGNTIDTKDYDMFHQYGKDKDKGAEMYNCVSVKLPEYKPNTSEVIKYANKSVKLKMRNYEDVDTLSLTFWETADRSMYQLIKSMTKITGMSENIEYPNANYNPWRFIDDIYVEILSNDLDPDVPVKTYHFHHLTLVNYSYDYQLDYTANALPLVTLEFNYRVYEIT